MRGLTFLALCISLCSAPSFCTGADASGGAQTPATTPAATPPLTDVTDPTVATLCHIACGDLPCCCHGVGHKGQNLAARLNAIDGIGGFKTFAAVQCLRSLLCELKKDCGKEHCSCGNFDRTLLALHAIQALAGMGSAASTALPEIGDAICISPDLAAVITTAENAVKPVQPAPTPAPTPTFSQAAKDLQKGIDDIVAAEPAFKPNPRQREMLRRMRATLEEIKHDLEQLSAASPKSDSGN